MTDQQQEPGTAPSRGGTITTIAGGVFDAFRTSPVLLLIVILNIAFAGSAAYFLVHQEQNHHDLVQMLLDRCLPPKPGVDR